MQAIGIDIGTTSICGVVTDVKTGEIIKSCTKNSEAFLTGCREWEKIQDTQKIIMLAKEITDSLITDETVVIGVTGQMHGIVYIDKNGKAVSPLYTWQDERGNLPYKDTTYAKYLNSFSGYGSVTDFYNRENGIRPKNAECYCTIHDYFVMTLCGLNIPVIHDSDYKSFGNNVEENKSERVSDYFIAGKYKDIPVSVAIGDNQASVFSTLVDENDVLINIGTGSQISVVSDVEITGENIEARPYFEGKYLIVGAALCGGRAYSILKDFYGSILKYAKEYNGEEIYEIMNRMLDEKGQSSLNVDTRFAGTRFDSSIKGAISGITAENFTPSALTYGVLDGMIKELYNMYNKMNKMNKMNVKRSGIVASGNGIRKNPHLCKIAENIFGFKLKIPAHLEEAAFGAALFGLVSCGVFKSGAAAQKLIKYNI